MSGGSVPSAYDQSETNATSVRDARLTAELAFVLLDWVATATSGGSVIVPVATTELVAVPTAESDTDATA